MLHKTIIWCLTLTIVSIALISSYQIGSASEWLSYDQGEAVYPSSRFPYQGVRFSLSDGNIRMSLMQIAFYYSTNASFCPVTLYMTDHSHSTRLSDPFYYNAMNGWNVLDVSALGISVPRNFYIILGDSQCGSLMMDYDDLERSFKGYYFKSLTTRLTHNLLIRAEVGESVEIPVLKQWDVSIGEKITIQQSGTATQRIMRDISETWNLYEDSSVVLENNIYGLWKQKKQKFQVSLDPEEVRQHLMDILLEYVNDEISDAIVTKIIFTGKVQADETIRGTVKVYAKISFFNSDISAKVTIERKFLGILAESAGPEAIVAQR